jgi:hypothetical protein
VLKGIKILGKVPKLRRKSIFSALLFLTFRKPLIYPKRFKMLKVLTVLELRWQ